MKDGHAQTCQVLGNLMEPPTLAGIRHKQP